jgi:iron complex outermembrane receptor protein
VPAVADPRLNLNNQPWSQPMRFDATTASLRVTQKFGEGWRLVAHGLTQRLRTDDYLAFPFGCTDPNPAPNGTYYPDRYCPDGTFDLYDFRSENERRRSSTLDLSLHGQAKTGPLAHEFSVGVQRTVVRNRFQDQAFNSAGTGNVDGTLVTPPAPALTTPNTNRDERSTELSVRDAIAFGRGTTATSRPTCRSIPRARRRSRATRMRARPCPRPRAGRSRSASRAVPSAPSGAPRRSTSGGRSSATSPWVDRAASCSARAD